LKDYPDPNDVCWTKRLYFNPRSLQDLFASFALQYHRFAMKTRDMTCKPKDPCVAGHDSLPQATAVFESMEAAAQAAAGKEDFLMLQVWMLFLYCYFPPARVALLTRAHEGVAFFLEPFLHMRFGILFSMTFPLHQSRRHIEIWLEATLQPVVARAYCHLALGSHKNLADTFALQTSTDFGELDDLQQAIFLPRSYEEWESFCLPPPHSPIIIKSLMKRTRLHASKMCHNPHSPNMVYPLLCNITRVQVPESVPMILALQNLFITHAFARRKSKTVSKTGEGDEAEADGGDDDEDGPFILDDDEDEDEDEDDEDGEVGTGSDMHLPIRLRDYGHFQDDTVAYD
jgi:hypothetical protein